MQVGGFGRLHHKTEQSRALTTRRRICHPNNAFSKLLRVHIVCTSAPAGPDPNSAAITLGLRGARAKFTSEIDARFASHIDASNAAEQSRRSSAKRKHGRPLIGLVFTCLLL